MIRLELKCKKQFAGDAEQYGIDFLIGNTYNGVKVHNNNFYVTSESGCDVEMNLQEVKETFMVICSDCKTEIEEDKAFEIDYDTKKEDAINTYLVCEKCFLEGYLA